MKHMATDLNNLNELIMFSKSIMGNFFFETFFEELEVELVVTKFRFFNSKQISNVFSMALTK